MSKEINKRDCRNCKHYFVCAYVRQFDYKLRDLLECIREPEISNNDEQRKLVFEFMAKACQYFNIDCYSKESKNYKESSQ